MINYTRRPLVVSPTGSVELRGRAVDPLRLKRGQSVRIA